MRALYKRELRAYFLSPLGYIFLGLFLLVAGLFFSLVSLFSLNPAFSNVLSSLLFVFLLIIPILTMRLISEDTSKKVTQLLYASPINVSDIVIGKYLAAVTVFFISLLVMATYPIIISFYGDVNLLGTYIGFLGFFLLGCAFISIGLFVSSTTESQVISAVVTFAALLGLWMIDSIAVVLPTDSTSSIIFCQLLIVAFGFFAYSSTKNYYLGGLITVILTAINMALGVLNPSLYVGLMYKLLSRLSLLTQFDGFLLDTISIGPVVYYISISTIFVILTIRNMEKRRWGE